jgi:hypothetical protein
MRNHIAIRHDSRRGRLDIPQDCDMESRCNHQFGYEVVDLAHDGYHHPVKKVCVTRLMWNQRKNTRKNQGQIHRDKNQVME